MKSRAIFVGLCLVGSTLVWAARGSAHALVWWSGATLCWAIALGVIVRGSPSR